VTVRVFGLAGTLFLTRHLTPSAYGEVSAALVSAMILSQTLNFSFGTYVIVHRSQAAEVFQGFVFHVAAIGLGCAGILLVGESLAGFLGVPGMARYLPGVALAMLITSFGTVPSATLVRTLRFRVVAFARATGEAVYTTAAVALVVPLGGWALVVASVARSIVSSTLLIARSDRSEWFRPVRPSGRSLRDMLRFGWPLSVSGSAASLSGNADNLLMAQLFGPNVMGQYNLAYNLAATPAEQVCEQIGDVVFPSLAAVEEEARRRAILRAAGLLAVLLFPVIAGLSAVAPTAVRTLLDPRWSGIAPMLALLAWMTVARPITLTLDAYLQVRKHNTALMLARMGRTVLVLGSLLLLSTRGPLWACAGVVLGSGLYAIVPLSVARWKEGVPAGPMVRAMVPPLLASILMAVVVVASRTALGSSEWSGWLALPAEVAVGAVAYGALAWGLCRRQAVDLINLLRGILRRGDA
jgi:PST family polysaccharide transporter